MVAFAIIGWGLAGLFFANWQIEKDRLKRTRELNGQLVRRIEELKH